MPICTSFPSAVPPLLRLARHTENAQHFESNVEFPSNPGGTENVGTSRWDATSTRSPLEATKLNMRLGEVPITRPPQGEEYASYPDHLLKEPRSPLLAGEMGRSPTALTTVPLSMTM